MQFAVGEDFAGNIAGVLDKFDGCAVIEGIVALLLCLLCFLGMWVIPNANGIGGQRKLLSKYLCDILLFGWNDYL